MVTDWSVMLSPGGSSGRRQTEGRRPDHCRQRTLSGGRVARRGCRHSEENQGHRSPHRALLNAVSRFDDVIRTCGSVEGRCQSHSLSPAQQAKRQPI